MQSPTQMDMGSNPVTTANTEQPLDSETDRTQPAQNEPDVQEKWNKSAIAIENESVLTQENEEETAGSPASVTVTQAVNESTLQARGEASGDTGEMGRNLGSKPCAPSELAPDTNTNPGCKVQKAKKQDKVVQDGRKYIPSKKAMIDPLKMDMSKPLVIPLTSSQLSLQCMDCHIIFSDHKSKERHLKLSHPAEYEQCILRNALFACYVCDRHFTNSTELMAHQKAHTEKKPFKCPICGQAFNKSSELTHHKKIHFGRDGYACTDCGKPCKTLTLLKYHRRTHTGERPYVCKDCGKRFSMPKGLQKHIESHFPKGAAGNTTSQGKKNDGASTVKYPCPVCKAKFKTTKTQLHHMKTKHNISLEASRTILPSGEQVKQSVPTITPISICQTALLQVEPNGPLQKVDANIDTEQIRRLIESLGNVQKVNQVVILGQVPPNAPPLEVQQISELAGPVTSNPNPSRLDLIEPKQTEPKVVELDFLNNTYDPMEQTIILEPITPDGQLENPPFSELGSHIATGENVELTLVQSVQGERPEGEVMHQILRQPEMNANQSVPMDQIVCHNEDVDLSQNLEQTVILELTPALIPTVELEQSQNVQQNEIPSTLLVPTTELENPPDQTKAAEHTGRSVTPFMPTEELELTPLQKEQQELPSGPLVPSDTLTQTPSESETNFKEEEESQKQRESLDQVRSVTDGATPQETQEKTVQELAEELLVESKESQEQVADLSEEKDSFVEETASPRLEAKEVPQISELPVNVMSAQELVKVRKRKSARAFIFQGCMQELIGSMQNEDLKIGAEPAKRQRTKKSHLVVKFSPQNKERKNKKQKKQSQQLQSTQEKAITGKTTHLKVKKVSPQRKGKKGKKDKKAGHSVTQTKIKTPSLTKYMPQIKEDNKKNNKIKKQENVNGTREDFPPVSGNKAGAPPLFSKKKQSKIMQKGQSNRPKDGKVMSKEQKKKDSKTFTKTLTDTPGPHITQDSLLLLKGHKQPQLKVYKLDPSKASGQTREASPHDSPTSLCTTSKSPNNFTTKGKKKGGRPKKNQKVLSLLSSLHQTSEPSPTKPKNTRKRKASQEVEIEGVITSSHSKRALECKDCGERFSEVSSLQKHKAMVHIAVSPGLTYTNGNIFEGVSRLDLNQHPKQHDRVSGATTAATDWDTEPEMVEMALEDREGSVSFPALIPSPSLPVPPTDAEVIGYKEKDGSKNGTGSQSLTSPDVPSLSDQIKNCEMSPNFSSEAHLNTYTQMKSPDAQELMVSDKDKQEEGTPKAPSLASEVQATMDEDIKEDLLLDVDLVTVGEQNEKDNLDSPQGSSSQNELRGLCNIEAESTETLIPPAQDDNETTEKNLSSQTVSCATHQVEVKEEEEEVLVQKKKGVKEAATGIATKGRRRGTGRLKRSPMSRRFFTADAVRGIELENEQNECRVVFEKCTVASDSDINEKNEAFTWTSQPVISQEVDANKGSPPAMSSTLEESTEEQIVFELESVTTSVEDVMNERREECNRETDQSPGIILEKFLTSGQRATVNNNQRQGLDCNAGNDLQGLGSQEIKVEENISDPLVAPACQNRQNMQSHPPHDIRTILVKEESSLMLNDAPATQGCRHIRWNVEQVNIVNTANPLMETEEKTCRVAPDFNANQCIFYPVKEEEREVLLGAAQSNNGTIDGPTVDQQTEDQTADVNSHELNHAAQDFQDTRVRGLMPETDDDSADGDGAEADAEWQHQSDLQSFLLQSSDEVDMESFELSNPHIDSEAEAMAYFYKNHTNSSQQPIETAQSLPSSSSQLRAPREKNMIREPIDYFSKYFGWDTWVEIAHCTSTVPQTVTAREVAQFVGIHIAMGTLKCPCPKLYWEDFTKVPLIAEAMPLSRFLELSAMLKLASPAKTQVDGNVGEERNRSKTLSSKRSEIPQHGDRQCRGNTANILDGSKTQMDPLWKVQPLLCRFLEGCQSLRRDGDSAVDQYSLPLTGKMHSNKPSLYCTTLIGFGGLLLDVDLKLDLSDKEDAVEKMVPKGSMVFLCKQELSTPAMLERLLVAGIHGAGRVGGERGQIGDEFVSSDGKLMLRRSHCGFILSTAGNGQRNMASLIDNFEKAQMSTRLNRDLQSLYSIPLTASAPTCWPQAVLWYLTDLALVNSWLLYRRDHGNAVSAPLTLMTFRLEVSKALILSSGSDTQDSVPPQPPTEKACATNETPNPKLLEESPLPDTAMRYDGSGHWPEQLGEGEGGRCRFGDCQRTSRVMCLKCCVFLCISRNHNCFLNFHNQGTSGKE